MFRKLAIVSLFLFLSTSNAFAYSEETTHPALTQEILNFTGGFSDEERAWIIQGSQLEDTPPRWVNHFYDPINNTGWTGAKAGYIPAEVLTGMTSVGAIAPVSAVDWVEGCNTQSAYYANGGNHTWDAAMSYYVKGDMKEAYITLGHILHIVEDMSVPDHTRDDSHAQNLGGDTGSPYEQYTAKYDPETIKALKISEGLKRDGLSAPQMNSLQEYLETMARYSNKYFFSKDTINDPKYPEPKILWDDGNFAYGKDENGVDFPLAGVEYTKTNIVPEKTYILSNKKEYSPILDAYFTRLSRQAVLNGAGIVKFFQKEAPNAKVNSEFFVDSQHTLGKVACATGDTLSLFTPMGIVSGIGNVVSSVFGQVVGTLKSGFGFVVGLVAPRAAPLAPPSTPAEEPVDALPVDTADDFAPDTEVVTDASDYSVTTGRLRMATSVAPMAPTPPRISTTTAAIKTLTATTTLKMVRVATTTATSRTIAYSSGGGGAPPLPSQTVIEKNQYAADTSTSTATNSTSTEEVATTTEIIATSTEESATSTASSTPVLTSGADHVLISEILFDAVDADGGKEFIELYNPTDSPKDLVGYSLHYKTENSTTTHPLATVRAATSTEQPIIPAHGFLLFGFDHYDPLNYGGATADISRTSHSLPNGADEIKISLLDSDDSEIDELTYDKLSIPASGYGLERMAWDGNACVSAQNGNEFLGNDCASGETQFEPRQIPRPQNSLSLPEPREKPTAPIAQDGSELATYNSSARTIDIGWTLSTDAEASTSGITYMLYDISSSTSVLITTTTATTSSMGTQPGRTYNLGLVAEDRDGLSSATTTFSVDAPGFLDNIYFYQDPRATTTARYLIDVRYSRYNPLIPPIVSDINWWEAIAFYLNREPNPANSSLPGDGSYSPGNHSDILQFPIFSFDPAKSQGYGQGLYHSSFVLPVEDGRLVLDSGLTSATSSDYITVAYYNHVQNGQNFSVGDFRLAATDARKIYLSALTALPPTTPQNLEVDFDPFHMQLGLSWASSTDTDSPDAEITYEINVSTSTELASSTWRSVDKSLSTGVGVSTGQNYIVGVRAVDDFGTRSPEITKSWNFPADYKPILLGQVAAGGYQDFVVPQDDALTELNIYTTDFYISGMVFSGPAFLCNISVYEMINGTPNLLATGDTHPADGVSGAYAYRENGCAGNLTFTFSGKPQLSSGHSYRWEYAFSSSHTDYHFGTPTVKFYGRDTNTVGGAFSDASIANAMFTLKAEDGILIQN